MFDVEDPLLNWTALATGSGVAGEQVGTEEGFLEALKNDEATKRPYLIAATV